jgi:hypothetical protein
MDGIYAGDETAGILINIKYSSVYITSSSIAVEDKKNQKLSRKVLLYKPVTMHYIQLITSKD